MERMPYQLQLRTVVATGPSPAGATRAGDWRFGLPTLAGSLVTVRELRMSDAQWQEARAPTFRPATSPRRPTNDVAGCRGSAAREPR